MIFLIIVFSLFKYNQILLINYFILNKNFLNVNYNYNLNLSYHYKIMNKIKISTFTYYLENGGRARITSLLLNYLYKIKIFNIFLFTIKNKNNKEYLINEKINRILINNFTINKLIKTILKKRINIFIYQFSYINEIKELNKLKNINVLVYLHQSIFFWIYNNYTSFISLYKYYKKSNYIISLIHMENDYIFQKWGIKSILMNNFIAYKYDLSFPLNLSYNEILMIGRADNRLKRFELGIQAMEYIVKVIPEAQMKIVTNITTIDFLMNIINILGLENNINFFGYTPIPEKYFKNISLNIITSISESFSLILSETKIYGIPNILIGLDYISIASGGTIIIYDDSPESIAKESIKILLNYEYRKKIGNEGRRNMKKYKNELLLKKWILLILLIHYRNDSYFEKFRKLDKKITEKKSINLLKNQIKFLKKRKFFKHISLKKIENFTFLENINYIINRKY